MIDARMSAAHLRPGERRISHKAFARPLPVVPVVAAAAAALILDTILIGTGGILYRPEGFAALTAEQVAGFVGAGLFWRSYRPGNPISTLLLATAVMCAGQGLQGASSPLVHTVGILFDYPTVLLVWWLLLAYPDGSIGRLGRASFVTMAGSIVFGFLPLLLLAPRPAGGAPLAACADACPRNVLYVGSEGASEVFRLVAYGGRAVATAAMIAALATALWRASGPRRRTLLPVSAIALVWACTFSAYGIGVGLLDVQPGGGPVLGPALSLARALVPFAFLLGPLYQRAFAGQALLQMITGLRSAADPAARERVIATTLRDPTLSLAYWLPRSELWVDKTGTPLERELGPQMWTIVRYEDDPTAAFIHDPALADDPDLLAAASRALLLVLDNSRLATELEESLTTLYEARHRLIAAGVAERRELEHELHAHAQQQLTALRVSLELAIDKVDQESAVAQRLVDLGLAFDEALAEVRRLAISIYPPLLERSGLRVALIAAAASFEGDVTVAAEEVGRHGEELEATVYFCVVEAVRHALEHEPRGTGAHVELGLRERQLGFSVCTDGAGLARRNVRAGCALAAAAERVAVIGGSVDLSATDDGSAISGVAPIQPRETA